MSADQHIDLEPYDPNDDQPGGSTPAPTTPAKPGSLSRSGPVEPLPLEPEPEPRKPIPVGIPIEEPTERRAKSDASTSRTPGSASPSTSAASSPSSSSSSASSSGSTYSVKELDVCPSCGAPMRGGDTLVCTRCGFDLKTMKNFRTATGVVEIDPDAEREAEKEVTLSLPGRGDMWLPGGIAAVCGLVLVIAYLAGVPGLFPGHKVEDIDFGLRITGMMRFVVLSLMCGACGMAGLFIMAYLLDRKVGDLQLAGMRMLAITGVIQLIMVIGFSAPWIEHVVEFILQLAAFAGLSLALFNIKPKETSYLVVSSMAVFLLLWLGSALVFWATTGA